MSSTKTEICARSKIRFGLLAEDEDSGNLYINRYDGDRLASEVQILATGRHSEAGTSVKANGLSVVGGYRITGRYKAES